MPSETGVEATPYTEKTLPLGEIVGSAKKGEKLWIDERRPNYDAECKWLCFLDQCYEGGQGYLGANNLTPFLIERGDADEVPAEDLRPGEHPLTPEYHLRKGQSSRFNLVAELVNSLVAFLSGRSPKRQVPKDQYLERFIEATNLARSLSLDEFSLEGARRLLLHGVTLTAVDMALTSDALRRELAEQDITVEADEEGFLTLSDKVRQALADKAIPHSYHVHPSNLLNAFLDAAGDLEEALIRETVHNGLGLKTGKSGYKPVYRLVTKKRWELYEVREEGGQRDLVLLNAGANPLGFVNLVVKRLRPKGDDDFRGVSFVEDWAFVDKTLYDLLSAFGWNLKENSATQIYLTGNLSQIIDPDVKKKEIAAAQKAAKSPMIVLGMDAKIGAVNKSFEQANLLLEGIERLMRFVFQLTGFRDKVQESNAPESGEARLRAFQVLNAHLAALGRILGPTERFQLKAAWGYLGGDQTEIGMDASAYPRAYDVRAVEDDLTVVEKLWGKAPPELIKAVLEDLARKLFAEKPPEWLDDLAKAIEAWEVPGEGYTLGNALGRLNGEVEAINQRRGGPPAEGEEEGLGGPVLEEGGGPAAGPPRRPPPRPDAGRAEAAA